jgi:hypothetical protein
MKLQLYIYIIYNVAIHNFLFNIWSNTKARFGMLMFITFTDTNFSTVCIELGLMFEISHLKLKRSRIKIYILYIFMTLQLYVIIDLS